MARREESQEFETRLREAAILGICIAHPGVIPQFAGRLEALQINSPEHERILSSILTQCKTCTESSEFIDRLDELLGKGVAGRILTQKHVANIPAIHDTSGCYNAEWAMDEELRKLEAEQSLREEIAELPADGSFGDEKRLWRLREVIIDRQDASVLSDFDNPESYRVATNGVRVDIADSDELAALARKGIMGSTR